MAQAGIGPQAHLHRTGQEYHERFLVMFGTCGCCSRCSRFMSTSSEGLKWTPNLGPPAKL